MAPPALAYVETEVVGFTLQGRKDRERLTIPDLDVVPAAGGRRLLPLLRLLEALHWETVEHDRHVSFQPEGSAQVVLDPVRGEVTIDGESRQLEVREAISDVTNRREIYIAPEEAAAILGFELTWHQENYGFFATTERSLAIWKVEKGLSLFAIKTEEISSNLPEAHPVVGPRSRYVNLDFIRLQGRANWNAVSEYSQGDLVADSLEQTFWGDFLKGRYKVRFSEAPLTWGGSGLNGTDAAFRVPWGEVEYRWDLSQVVVGDSVFGLNDLTFPSVRITGLRFNGLLGVDGRLGESDRSGRGTNLSFNRPLGFSGHARVGSKVSLIVNGLAVETVEVLTSLPDEAGVGLFSFNAIQVAPGSLNEIRIVIIDPDGIETVVEKKIVGSSSLMPKGAVAYLGGVGTYREPDEWFSRGLFAGTRLLYGLGASATFGATVAYQEDFFDPEISFANPSGERPYPVSSSHAGAQLVWQPFDRALLSGDISWATPEYTAQADKRTGLAWRVNADLLPVKSLQLHGRYFVYEPDFFDGQSRNLRDKQGYVLHGSVSPLAGLEFSAATARVEDNVQGDLPETRAVDIQHAAILTQAVPRSTCTVAYDRLAPSWGEETQQLASIEVRGSPVPAWSFYGYYSTGDDVSLGENTDFLDGLRLPAISLAETRHASASLSRELPWGGSLQLQYRNANYEERVSLVHSTGSFFGATLLMRTEVGRDLENEDYIFEHRAEYPLPGFGGSRLQAQARYDRDVWSVGISFTLLEIFRNDAVPPRRVRGARFDPETGSVAGSVFVDANANAVRDPGEPGLDNIKVFLDGIRTEYTDDRGAFLFPAISGKGAGKVFIDAKELPATYLCTHCLQKYRAEAGRVVEVHFGVAPANTVSGTVLCRGTSGAVAPLSGLRVVITPRAGKEPAATSITAGDGSYYLGNILPGAYLVRVDPDTIPGGIRPAEAETAVDLAPAVEPQDVEGVDIILESFNETPVTEDISAVTSRNSPIAIMLSASDKERDALTFSVVDGPEHGTLTGRAPRLTYVPEADFAGTDVFSFTASDGTSTSTPSSVSVTVQPNRAPEAVDDAARTTAGVVIAIAVLDNDKDPDGDALEVTAALSGANGTVTYSSSGVRYAPKAGFVGDDAFAYTAGDGRGGSSPAIVRVKVAAAAPSMHVANISKWLVNEMSAVYAKARVLVVDNQGLPVQGVAVYAIWSDAVAGSAEAVTNARGTAVLSSPRIAEASEKRFVISVTGLARDGWRYDQSADVESRDSIWGP